MISFLNRHRKTLFIATISVFLIGTFVGLGGYLFTSRDMTEAVASVGAVKIPYVRYRARVDQYLEALRSRDGEVSDDMVKRIKVDMLRDMIVDEMLLVKAEEMGITVTDEELARDIRATPAFQAGGEFSPQSYFRVVRSVFRETPQGYEEMRRRSLIAGRLKQLIFHAAKLSPAELDEAFARERQAGGKKVTEKDRPAFAAKAQQLRALELINYFLRQVSSQVEVKSFLDQRESGV
ncbi:MAG: SurA N-terminal domain-containing protein [Elusimicrobia bacterium]|nr:SurA N-terminal domain-containing protein [Elusimicrobiota bacterium]